jgi:hypothetical protein
MLDQELWNRIAAFDFDDERPKGSFEQRLAREKGWSSDFTKLAIREYRRFLYLAVKAGHMATPSKVVDEVWHLHLQFTKNYWEELCAKVLEKPLHHQPGSGDKVEEQGFLDAYQATLLAYQREFRTVPPREVWPQVSTAPAVVPVARKVSSVWSWITTLAILCAVLIGAWAVVRAPLLFFLLLLGAFFIWMMVSQDSGQRRKITASASGMNRRGRAVAGTGHHAGSGSCGSSCSSWSHHSDNDCSHSSISDSSSSCSDSGSSSCSSGRDASFKQDTVADFKGGLDASRWRTP